MEGVGCKINKKKLLKKIALKTKTERCSELLMDKESTVRSCVLQTFRVIFSLTSSIQMSAFFPLLSAHLCCAMTHIDENIQQDSLPVLDLCLDHVPELVIQNSSRIMSNFIEQISRLTQTTNKGIFKSHNGSNSLITFAMKI